jgi:hypothetical protein
MYEIIDLPRNAWRVLPPSRWQIALAVAAIVIVAVTWAVT